MPSFYSNKTHRNATADELSVSFLYYLNNVPTDAAFINFSFSCHIYLLFQYSSHLISKYSLG